MKNENDMKQVYRRAKTRTLLRMAKARGIEIKTKRWTPAAPFFIRTIGGENWDDIDLKLELLRRSKEVSRLI